MPEIRFEYEVEKRIEVLASEDGHGILIIDLDSNNELSFESLSLSDQKEIKMMIKDWVNYFKDMNDFRHPAYDAFSSSYVTWLNKEMGK